MVMCRLLSNDEFHAMEEIRRENHRPMKDVFLPGMMWSCWWYHSPDRDEDDKQKMTYLKQKIADGTFTRESSIFSIHYWRDWSHIRPPLCVVCPDGSHWIVDQRSSNGDGWIVTGDAPNITCTPSILVPGYHGFLQQGKFSSDLENRSY